MLKKIFLFPLFACAAPILTPFVDFLYWEAQERGIEFAQKNTGTASAQSIQTIDAAVSYKPAFRIGLSGHMPGDPWDLEVSYTRFFSHTHQQTSGSLFAVWAAPAAPQIYSFASSSWDFHAQIFDLLLKDRFATSASLCIEPGIGVKCALLNQSYLVLYSNPSAPNQISMKNNSFNLGPNFFLSLDWLLHPELHLIGSLSTALFASRFSLTQDHFWTGRPQVSLTIGLEWTHSHFGLGAYYEAQMWWKQNMLMRFIDSTSSAMISPSRGDLSLQGLTLDLFYDF